MAKYRLTQGKHYINNKKHVPGDIVEMPYLSPGLKDRFEKVDVVTEKKVPAVYKAVNKGSSNWIVADLEGQQIHSGYLNKKEADRLANEYNLEHEHEQTKANKEEAKPKKRMARRKKVE